MSKGYSYSTKEAYSSPESMCKPIAFCRLHLKILPIQPSQATIASTGHHVLVDRSLKY